MVQPPQSVVRTPWHRCPQRLLRLGRWLAFLGAALFAIDLAGDNPILILLVACALTVLVFTGPLLVPSWSLGSRRSH